MAAQQANIELIAPSTGMVVPSCPHGPAMLFERFDQSSKTLRQFFACSAFRDKKECSFHQWVDEKSTETPSAKSESFSHRKIRVRARTFRNLPRRHRHVCCTCGLLLLPAEISDHEKQGHTIKDKIGLKDLRRPSYLFTPRDNNKTYAQYLFSPKAINFLLDSVQRFGYTHILCVGTPRIHEEIQFRKKAGDTALTSMLLDLDDRYAQLYSPALYTKYNMFNHHFFEVAGWKRVQQFLKSGSEGVLLLTDPPFGGMVEALAQSFLQLSQMWKMACLDQASAAKAVKSKDALISLVWIFPYFMESRIVANLPSLCMLDYKVDYDNHNLFNSHHKKKGSPVRIFTNISPADFYLPENEGYWFCDPCQRYSSSENQHCKECGTCPSKDGTTYVHCDICLRCVKPSRVHCFKCEMCTLRDHQCGKIILTGCHICGDAGHKRRECPKRHSSETNGLKRKQNTQSQNQGKKKKKR